MWWHEKWFPVTRLRHRHHQEQSRWKMRDKCVFMTCCDTRQPPDTRGAHTGPSEKLYNHGLIKCVVYVKALLGAFNYEKALVGAFSMIVKASPMVRLHNHITFSLRLPRYPRIYKPRTCIFLCVDKYGPYLIIAWWNQLVPVESGKQHFCQNIFPITMKSNSVWTSLIWNDAKIESNSIVDQSGKTRPVPPHHNVSSQHCCNPVTVW